MTSSVEVRGLTRRYGATVALNNVSLRIDAGCFAVLLGPSGCGKTTLLSILGGFLAPSEGKVLIGDDDVTGLAPAKRPTTTVFQDYALFPHMTLAANVGFGLRMRGVTLRERTERARAMLDLVGLPDAFNKKPHELSGGQRQRVALARALAVEPDVLLLDEPLGALDLALRRQMQDELKAIQRRVGTTFVHVTHDQEEALAIADDIVIMNGGKIEDVGTPETIYLRPKTPFAATFIGAANLIPCRRVAHNAETEAGTVTVSSAFGDLTLPAAALRGGDEDSVGDDRAELQLCLRPEHIELGAAGAQDASDLDLDLGFATVESCAFFGAYQRCHLRPEHDAQRQLVAHLPQTAAVAAGDRVALRSPVSAAVLLTEPAV